MIPGGQLMYTSDIENFPGFPEPVGGQELMGRMREQAERFGTRIATDDVTRVDFTSYPFRLWTGYSGLVEAKAVIIATGARANWIGLPNEERLARNGAASRRARCATAPALLPQPAPRGGRGRRQRHGRGQLPHQVRQRSRHRASP
jgi:thioredoxin reductase (NADPH)